MKLQVLQFMLIASLFAPTVQSQDCKAYIPHQEGTTMEITSYDKKGKSTGIVKQEITKIEFIEGSTKYFMNQVVYDEKGEEQISTEVVFKCKDNVFYLDMNNYIPQESLEAYQNMDLKITASEIDIPANLSPGQKLNDGNVTIDISGDMPMNLSMRIDIVNRKVLALESVTTPAGIFDCVKISQDVISKFGFTVTLNSIEWYAVGVGAVKSETYKKGKLIGSTALTKFSK